MTEQELKVLKRIPKKYRKHIVELEITESLYFDDRGHKIYNYTLTYDNDMKYTFDNQSYMLYMLKEYDVNGYYESP